MNQEDHPGAGFPQPASPAVDFERLSEITANNQDLLREIVRQYLTQAEEILAEMEQSARSGTHEHTTKLAHKLAGSSATCGMTGIVPTMRAIEYLTPGQSGAAIPLHQEATRQLLRIRQALAGLIP